MVKKIKAITAFLHQPLTEATDVASEVGALMLAQEISVMKLISQLLAFNHKKVLLKSNAGR